MHGGGGGGGGRGGRAAKGGKAGKGARVAGAVTIDGIAYMAQLKVLRALQEDLNDRTQAFAAKNPDQSKLSAWPRMNCAA